MSKVKVSVVVPFWNVEEFFPRFLDSVLHQTLTEIELILVDDCSTDGSFEIASSYQRKDPRIILLQNPVHSGSGGMGRQRGMEAASGDHIVFWDADDLVEPDTLETLCRIAEENSADVVTFGYDQFFQDRIVSREGVGWPQTGAPGKDTLVNFYLPTDRSLPFCQPMLCNKFIRRSLIAAHRIRHPEGLVRMQELPFSVQCIIHAGKVVYCPRIFYHWRLNNPNSITKSRNIPLLLTVFTTIFTTMDLIREAGFMTETVRQSAYTRLWQSVQMTLVSSDSCGKNSFLHQYSCAAKDFLLKYDPEFFGKNHYPTTLIQSWFDWLAVIDRGLTGRYLVFLYRLMKCKYVKFSLRDLLRGRAK